jgi:hypothetical protein
VLNLLEFEYMGVLAKYQESFFPYQKLPRLSAVSIGSA